MSRLQRYARPAAFLLLLGVTVYGLVLFFSGDWTTVMGYWRDKVWSIPLVLLFACCDVLLEGVAWASVYTLFSIPVLDGAGARAYLSGRAGLLLPAQLGRLLRPDAVVRLERGSASDCLKAETVTFVLDTAAVAALLAGLLAWSLHPLLAPVAAIVVVVVACLVSDLVAGRLLWTGLELPRGLWWRKRVFVIVAVQMAGWAASGAALWVVTRGIPGDVSLREALLYAAGTSVVGVGSGLPGGVGATEALLGASLRLGNVPADHLVIVIAGFRLLTFWIWIPVGWLAMLSVRRRTGAAEGLRAGRGEARSA